MTEPAKPNAKPLAYRVARALGNIWIGVALLLLLALYLGFVSVFIKTAMHWLGTSELGVYSHPIPMTLTAAAAVNLVLSTLTRVRFRWENLGALITHAGLLVFAVGCTVYVMARDVGLTGTPWTPLGFPTVSRYYESDTYAVYAWVDKAPETQRASRAPETQEAPDAPKGAETLLDLRPPVRVNEHRDVADVWLRDTFHLPRYNQARVLDLDVPLAGLPDGVSARVTKFYPATLIEGEVWSDDAARPTPGLDLSVFDPAIDKDRAGRQMLAYSRPRRTFDRNRDYLLMYAPEPSQQLRANLQALADPEGPGDPLHVVLFSGRTMPVKAEILGPKGTLETATLPAGRPLRIVLGRRREITVQARALVTRAASEIQLKPLDKFPPMGHGTVISSARIEVRAGSFSQSVLVPYDSAESFADPVRVKLPRGRVLNLRFSGRSRPLPQKLHIDVAEFRTHPGTRIPKDYYCRVTVGEGSAARGATLALNRPVHLGPYQISQSNWNFWHDHRSPSMIMLGVGSRTGLPVIWTGCWMICLGFPYAFYVKPLLRRRRRARA